MESELDSVYEEVSSLPDEEYYETNSELSGEESNEEIYVDSESDDSVLDSIPEEVDSEHEFYTSSLFETDSDTESNGFLFVESSCESSSQVDSYAERLDDIAVNTRYSAVFNFVLLILFILAIFTRFLINLIF